MVSRTVVLVLILLVSLEFARAITISLQLRCPCRVVRDVKPRYIARLRIFRFINCPLQVLAVLRGSNKKVCVNPKMKWLFKVAKRMQ
uniref:stromal cell-derived factor 1 n=1 Tax=Myxine glutinosa TaxID=7769 RepID=UPI00358E0C96